MNEGRLPEPAAHQPAPEPPPGVSARPLVGRTGEWQTLVAEHRACEPDGRLVVIEGEAGVGKTRLGEELLDAARGRREDRCGGPLPRG